MEFSEIFTNLIESNDYSFRELSLKTNISATQLAKYAKGIYEPSLKNALIISNYFNYSLDYLFGLETFPNRFGVLAEPSIEKFIDRFNSLISKRKTNINRISKNTFIKRNNIYNWQKLKIFPKMGILSKLAIELSTSIEYLIGRTNIEERI